MDREKVIKYLAVRIQSDSEEWNTIELPVEQAKEILAILKEQETLGKRNEPIKPTKNVYGEWLCGKCGNGVVGQDWMTAHGLKHERHAFCRDCGQAVKWDDL